MPSDPNWFDSIMAIFHALQNTPLIYRHGFFCAWLLTSAFVGAMVFYGIPLLKFEEVSSKPRVEPNPLLQPEPAQPISLPQQIVEVSGGEAGTASVDAAPVQVANSTVDKVIAASVEANNTQSENVITGPTQVEISPSASSGSVQAAIGNNVEAPKELSSGLYTQNIGGTVNIYFGNGKVSVEKNTVRVTEASGGSADIEVYTLFNSASWAYKSSSKLITYKDQDITLEEFLVSDGFMTEVKSYQAIVCLGLASGAARGEVARTVALSDERATHLCGLVSRKIYATSATTKVFGLPLGYHLNGKVKPQTREEKEQRSVVILGIRATSGSLENEEKQNRVISEILKHDGLSQLKSSDYSELKSGKPLRYLRIERGIYSAQ